MSNIKDNLTLIKEEFEQLKGQFVITPSHRIERFVAIASDSFDYYYVTYDGREYTWNSCVGGLIPLKGHLRDKDYNELVRMAKLNHYDCLSKNGEFEKVHNEWLEHTISGGGEILTEFCFDLN